MLHQPWQPVLVIAGKHAGRAGVVLNAEGEGKDAVNVVKLDAENKANGKAAETVREKPANLQPLKA